MGVTYAIVMVENLELYQMFYRISDPRWSCSTVEFLESPELVFQSWSSAKHALKGEVAADWRWPVPGRERRVR
jgi:hypothetical protein